MSARTARCIDCGAPIYEAKLRCRPCYRRQPGTSYRPLAERFWAKVDKSGDCWVWTGSASKDGYGFVGIGEHATSRAHRVSWRLTFGDIPVGMLVCHHCDNPRCVRPDHLFLGTNADNMADMMNKGRPRKGMKLSHDQVRQIRAAALPVSDLATKYGVHVVTIRGIRSGRVWAKLP